MRRERVSDDIYVFTSDLYAQVTASAIVAKEGIVVIDTLPFPTETREMINYLNATGQGAIKYLVNTHWHGDHTNGNSTFAPSVELVSHQRCQQALLEFGATELAISKENNNQLDGVEIRIPEVVFEEGEMVLHLGNKSIELALMPGHTHDSTVAYVREDKVLIASDTVMPVPYFVWGDRHVFKETLRTILQKYNLESIVQGHGEVLLRGEIPAAIESSIRYLNILEERIIDIIEKKRGEKALVKLTIDSCGKSRIPLNGLVQDLHKANVNSLYNELLNERFPESAGENIERKI